MHFLKQVSLKLRLIRGKRFLGSLIYPLQRERLEYQARERSRFEAIELPGAIHNAESTVQGGHFDFGHLGLELEFLASDMVCVHWTPGVAPVPYAIAKSEWEPVEVTFEDQGDRWLLSSSALKVIVYQDASLEFQDLTGRVVRKERSPQRSTTLPMAKSHREEGWIHQADLRPEEQIHGLGERAAPLNLRTSPDSKGKARTYRMWNNDPVARYGSGTDPLYMSIPVYVGLHSQGSYLIFYENSHPATFRFKETATAEFDGGALRYYVAVGSLPQLLKRYTELTGRPPLPPCWAFGYHQSRWGYEQETVLRETAHRFVAHDLPLSAMHLDIDCLDSFRAFTIDPDRFPNLAQFAQELAERGTRLIIIVNPGVKAGRNNRLFQEGREQKVFCTQSNGEPVLAPVWPGMCAFPDFTNPQARHWWSRQYQYLLDLGIAGFWHDMNEPAVFALWGDRSLPGRSTHHAMEGRGGNHQEAHNLYGFLQARAGYEALQNYQPEQRPFIVSRSGWAGIQRYAWSWTGDIESSWQALQQTIPTVLNLSLSGMPYTGPDIGGFQGNPSAELYIRWFQMAAFLPFCRTHSASSVKHRTPWSFGEPALSIVRDLLKFRERLIPYFYTLAWQTNQTGCPLVRPVFWDSPEDQELWEIEDAFLLGDALLVCPIVHRNMQTRQIRLPEGYWYHFWTDAIEAGANQIELHASLNQVPLLVKAGTILPMVENQQLILHLYPSVQGNCAGEVYSDAGDGFGEKRIDRFCLTHHSSGLELTRRQEGNYPFPYIGIRICLHGVKIRQIQVDGISLTYEKNCFGVDDFDRIQLEIEPAIDATKTALILSETTK
ncbi:glycoside hydrolase family 31 protein [Microcoleus sp. FACHB-1515]|uniref:glycoside hydrolase family 31 protein n=1 Tax=Cyanophyceae TaxID=3028117 RepID=UPI001685AE76|nr:glycoside hydrolase family 31 protein [Microcoleus sp. FACHB-1515]MBD2093466.1 glycoside hydrolase family 31 protein [Microcoleus sp. FACHB-1515]